MESSSSFEMSCTKCHQRLRVREEYRAKELSCPSCGAPVVLAAPVAEPVASRPRPTGAEDAQRPGWRTLRQGLTIVYWARILQLTVVVVLPLLGVVVIESLRDLTGAALTAVTPQPEMDVAPFLGDEDLTMTVEAPVGTGRMVIGVTMAGLAMLIAELLAVIGLIFCCYVPELTGLRGRARGAAVCAGAALFLLGLAAIGGPAAAALGALTPLPAFAATCFLLWLLHGLAVELESYSLQQSIRGLLKYCGALVCVAILATGAALSSTGPAAMAWGLLGLLCAPASVVAAVWGVLLLDRGAKLIDAREYRDRLRAARRR